MTTDSDGNSQHLVEAVRSSQHAVMAENVIKASGAGKAYQSVAQSTAIAVQDAADYMRNMAIISTTATGVAMAELIATGDPKYADAIATANKIVVEASTNFTTIGAAANKVLSDFPSS